MRVLVSAPGAAGHVNSMLALSGALRDDGHEVCWATGPEMCAKVAALGYDARAAGLDADERLRTFAEKYPANADLPPAARRLLMFPGIFAEINAPPMLTDLNAVATEFRPDLFLHGAAEFAAPIVAARHGKVNVAHGFGAPLPMDLVERASELAAPLWRAAGLEPPRFGGLYEHLYVDVFPPELDSPARPPCDVQPVQPQTIDAFPGDRLPPRVAKLDGPIVYVSFGTVFNTPEAFAPVLEACSKVDANILVTVGPGQPVERYEGVADNIVVEQYVPQSLVFGRCAAVVSHAGSGTFLQAVRHGLPQLCVPQAADQHVNAAAGVTAGVALSLGPPDATPERIGESIRRLLDDHRFAGNAAALAERVAMLPTPSVVARRLATLHDESGRTS